MEKSEIIDVLKEEGLDLAEDLAVNAVRGAISLIKTMLPKINSMVAILLIPLLDQLEPVLLDMLDKIDGQDDPTY